MGCGEEAVGEELEEVNLPVESSTIMAWKQGDGLVPSKDPKCDAGQLWIQRSADGQPEIGGNAEDPVVKCENVADALGFFVNSPLPTEIVAKGWSAGRNFYQLTAELLIKC